MKGTLMPSGSGTPAKKAVKKSAPPTSKASSPTVSPGGAKKKAAESPVKVEGQESLVSKGQQDYEKLLTQQRKDTKDGNHNYPKVDVNVSYPVAPVPEPPKTEVKDVEFVQVHHLDERRQLPGSAPYLDDVERLSAEVQRAKVEGRKPDLDNPPSTQGTPLVTVAASQLPVPEGAHKQTLGVTVEK